MNQVKIGVKPPAAVHAFQLAKTILKKRRETGNKFGGYKSIQFLKPGCSEWIQDSGQWCRGSEVGSNTEVGNFTEQHHGLDKQQERISVLSWMSSEDVWGEQTLGIVCNGLLQTRSGKCSPRCRNPFTHISFKVLGAKGKFRPNVSLINAVDPSPDRHNAIEEHRHPPSTAPEFQIERILGRCKVSARRTDAMSRKSTRIIQAKGYGSSRLEPCEHPDLDPAAFGIEVPG